MRERFLGAYFKGLFDPKAVEVCSGVGLPLYSVGGFR